MLASFLKSLPQLQRTWKPLNFSNLAYTRIAAQQKIEEETLPDYVASRYYPVRIGEVLKDRYQVVGKLGFGASSTVWLARDMRYGPRPRSQFMLTRLICSHRRHVVLKIFIHSTAMGQHLDDELKIYKRMETLVVICDCRQMNKFINKLAVPFVLRAGKKGCNGMGIG